MNKSTEIPLVLGGHSFISQMGNDRKPSEDAQVEIVDTCLDSGIRWFDTTYLPERRALGGVLNTLGRRAEATIMAWNFFKDFGDEDDEGKPELYQVHHIDEMLEQLQTDWIDVLVIRPLEYTKRNRSQEELIQNWQESKYVKRLGIWHPEPDAEETYLELNPYSAMVQSYNIASRGAVPAFSMAKRLGWETIACSPFIRGWKLDELVNRAVDREPGGQTEGALRSKVAGLMFRFSLFGENVDRLIVSIRRYEWIERNIESYQRGALTEEEHSWLEGLLA